MGGHGRHVVDAACGLTLEDGWPCGSYTPGQDGRCASPSEKGGLCRHFARCHDRLPGDFLPEP